VCSQMGSRGQNYQRGVGKLMKQRMGRSVIVAANIQHVDKKLGNGYRLAVLTAFI